MSTLNPYMLWGGEDPAEGAILVFAHTAREAKRIGWPELRGWSVEYVDVRVRRLRDHREYLMSLYNGSPVIGSPPTCNVCEMWGAPIREDGKGCAYCYGAEATP